MFECQVLNFFVVEVIVARAVLGLVVWDTLEVLGSPAVHTPAKRTLASIIRCSGLFMLGVWMQISRECECVSARTSVRASESLNERSGGDVHPTIWVIDGVTADNKQRRVAMPVISKLAGAQVCPSSRFHCPPISCVRPVRSHCKNERCSLYTLGDVLHDRFVAPLNTHVNNSSASLIF
jgi:hypothetical protein